MTPNPPLANTASEELPWLAFLYVSEEMSPEEAQDFEERLMTDQAAREAVAQAMKMSEGLWMASAMDSLNLQPTLPVAPAVVSPTRGKRSFSAIWLIGTLVAASLAFFVGWWYAQHQAGSRIAPTQNLASRPPLEIELAAADVEGAEQLLVLWTDSESLLTEWESGPTAEYAASDVSSRDLSDSEEDAFSWMLAAVSEPSAAMPPEPAVLEN